MKRFNSILCVVDPEKTFDTAVTQSISIAEDHQSDITFVSVLGTANAWRSALGKKKVSNEDLDALIRIRRSAIESRLAVIAPAIKPKIEIYTGIGFIEIIKSAVNNRHDLVVKCAEDSDWLRRLFGSEDMHLLRKCPCPVLMLKPGQQGNFRNILATVDVNDDDGDIEETRVQQKLNQQVLEYSATLSMPELTELHIGSAWEAYGEDFHRHGAFSHVSSEKVDEYVEQVRRECSDKLNILVKEMDNILGKEAVQYLRPKVHLEKGEPSKEIPLMTEKYGVDLIVMGTVGRIGIPGLIIGNTAESILEQVKCSVLAIKPEGFKSPVL